jgi:hypothetical protein
MPIRAALAALALTVASTLFLAVAPTSGAGLAAAVAAALLPAAVMITRRS